jgi:hypothetical protein
MQETGIAFAGGGTVPTRPPPILPKKIRGGRLTPRNSLQGKPGRNAPLPNRAREDKATGPDTSESYWRPSSVGYGGRRPAIRGLRLHWIC